MGNGCAIRAGSSYSKKLMNLLNSKYSNITVSSNTYPLFARRTQIVAGKDEIIACSWTTELVKTR